MASFPKHDIDPKLKNEKWFLQAARAAWDMKDTYGNMFYKAAHQYEIYRTYMAGRQDIAKYKPLMGEDENANNSNLAIDWTPRKIAPKFCDIGMSKILQRKVNIVATPIDATAKSEEDAYYAEVEARIRLREVAQQVAPELAGSPALAQQRPDEPQDMEELEINKTYGFKSQFAMEAEDGINLVFDHNDNEDQREVHVRNYWIGGVSGVKEWIENGMVKTRPVHIDNVVTNFCHDPHFKDLWLSGEVIKVSLQDLAGVLPDDVRKRIADTKRSPGELSRFSESYDECVVEVLDLEFLSTDEKVYQQYENREGNFRFKKARYDYRNSDEKTNIGGEMQNRYSSKKIQNVYKGKWIVDTDIVYDFGLATDMKREPNAKQSGCTSLSYHFTAVNKHKMQAQGIMERLVPIIDEYQLTVYRVQNFKNKWIPYVTEIDFDALEDIQLGGKSGKTLNPMEVMDLMFQTHTLLVRKKGMDGNPNPNYKAVDIHTTGMAQEFSVLAEDLQRLIQDMRDVTGLNEITDGSTPNERTLNGVANMAVNATNTALWPIFTAEKKLMQKLAKGVVQRLQILVQQGDVSGVAKALGSDTVQFLRVTKAIAPYVFGIKIEDKPTDEEKQQLLAQMNLKDSQGLIDPEDFAFVMEIDNLKKARKFLAYRIKKRRQEQQQMAMQQQQQNGQIQVQSAQAKAQADQQLLQLEYQLKMQLMEVQKQWDLKIAELNAQSKAHAAVMNHDAKLAGTMMNNESAERQQQAEIGAQPEMVDDFSGEA